MNTENREKREHRCKVKIRSFLCTPRRLVRWLSHRVGRHNNMCRVSGSWDIMTGDQLQGHHCAVTGRETAPSDHLPPLGWARPATRGELRDNLRGGVACEVAAHVAEMTATMLRGWLDFDAFTVRPSSNAGWTLFEPNSGLDRNDLPNLENNANNERQL